MPTAHPTLTMAAEGTPQNIGLRKAGYEVLCGQKNADPTYKSMLYLLN
jgi:hypothetical protein